MGSFKLPKTKTLALGTSFAIVNGIGIASLVSSASIPTPLEAAKVKFKNKYKKAFIDTKDNLSEWDSKYKLLKSVDLTNGKLKEASLISDKEEAIAKIKEVCEEIQESEENEFLIKDLISFCTYNNGDIDNITLKSSSEFYGIRSTFNSAPEDSLTDGFKKIRKNEGTDWGTKMLSECERIKNSLFGGRDTVEYKNLDTYCKKS